MLSHSYVQAEPDGTEEIPVKRRVHSWLTRIDQRQHNDLARRLLLPFNEIVDRLQAELLIDSKQVHIQHKQIPLAGGCGRWQGWGGGAVRHS